MRHAAALGYPAVADAVCLRLVSERGLDIDDAAKQRALAVEPRRKLVGRHGGAERAHRVLHGRKPDNPVVSQARDMHDLIRGQDDRMPVGNWIPVFVNLGNLKDLLMRLLVYLDFHARGINWPQVSNRAVAVNANAGITPLQDIGISP